MRYVKPDFYETFACTADLCPDTCCAGWKIMIDEDSLDTYSKVKGSFGKRLRSSIDWEDGCFYQYNRRCAFLNDRNLCDLYLALGEEGFCDTCRKYPRHTEEFEGLREYSLSLSCPVAAQMILSQQGMPVFVTEEDEKEDELEEEFEDFDLMLFTQLEDARKVLFEKIAYASADKVQAADNLHALMEEALALAEQMQYCVEDGRYFEIEERIADYRSKKKMPMDEKRDRFASRFSLFEKISSLERLREEWSDVLAEMQQVLYVSPRHRHSVEKSFLEYLDANPQMAEQHKNVQIQLFIFFVYTYFCGAVYDGWVYSKLALAVRSVEFLEELFMVRWKRKEEITFEDYVELSYRYAREIEHSDQNLIALEEAFMEEIVELE